MRQFLLSDEKNTYTLYVGGAQEVKALYRSMYKAWIKGTSGISNMYCDFPKFNYEKCYGLLIHDVEKRFHVVSSDTALRMIFDI